MGSRSVTQFFDQTLAPAGLRSTQLVILTAAELFGPSSIAQLARELVMDRSTLTRNLKPLLTMELLELTVANNGKHKSVVVTDQGRDALVRSVPYWNLAQDHVVSRIGAEQWKRMVTDLGVVIDATRDSLDESNVQGYEASADGASLPRRSGAKNPPCADRLDPSAPDSLPRGTSGRS